MQIQNRLSIERCRELLPRLNNLSDEKAINQRNRLYDLAYRLIEKFEAITNFITRARSVDARARIVK